MKKSWICISAVLILLCLPTVLAFEDRFSVRGEGYIYDGKLTISLWSNGDNGAGNLELIHYPYAQMRAKLKQVYKDGNTIIYSVKATSKYGNEVERFNSQLYVHYDGGESILLQKTFQIPVTRLR